LESTADDPKSMISILQFLRVERGPTIAMMIKGSALEAGLFSIVGIFLYILLRFRNGNTSPGSVIALSRFRFFVIVSFCYRGNTWISFEIRSISRGSDFAIIGYSINDTVIHL